MTFDATARRPVSPSGTFGTVHMPVVLGGEKGGDSPTETPPAYEPSKNVGYLAKETH